MIEIAITLLAGFALLALARFSRKRHEAKFGAAPPRHHKITFLYFALWSLAYALLGWQFLDFLTNFFAVLVALTVLYTLLREFVDIGLFKDLGWSRRQQLRDSFLFASLFILPVTLLYFHAAQV